MKYISKAKPLPTKLNPFSNWVLKNASSLSRLSGAVQWKKLPKLHKSEVQDILLEEQGYICAYCNRSIHKGSPEDDHQLRIDHVKPKVKHPNQTFDYYNLVGCCFGDDRTLPPNQQHCDASKKNFEIPVALFPTNNSCESSLIFTATGEVISQDPVVADAVNTILNLNCSKLRKLRKEMLEPLLQEDIQPDEAKKLAEFYGKTDSGKLKNFCGVIIGYLRPIISSL